jgi:hypothetical protein
MLQQQAVDEDVAAADFVQKGPLGRIVQKVDVVAGVSSLSHKMRRRV